MKSLRRTAALVLISGVLMGAPCGLTREIVHTVQSGSIEVRYWKVAERRVGRTLFEYDFASEVINHGGGVADLEGRVSTSAPAAEIVDGLVGFGAVATEESAQSGDDWFSLRQDREVPFDPSQISWSFRDGQLPPDPGEVGIETLGGLDVDGDGIRDDIQRWLVASFDQGDVRSVLLEKANRFGDTYEAAPSTANSEALAREIFMIGECLYWVQGEGWDDGSASRQLEARFFNTDQRLRAYSEYNESAARAGGRLLRDSELDAQCPQVISDARAR